MTITNANTEINGELRAAAQELLAAAYAYWQLYQQHIGSAAVVWLDDDSGHFVLFTRGEYKESLLVNANLICDGDRPLDHPFEIDT